MLILGFNAYHGDVAAAVLRDGVLVAAVEEERFRRIKHVAGFPEAAIRECLRQAGATPADVDVFAVARAKRAHLVRKAWFALTHRPGRALARQHRDTARRHDRLAATLAAALDLPEAHVATRLRHVEHHPAHLASAFYASGLPEAAACAIDGFGDFVSTSTAHGRGGRLEVLDRVFFPHSLGILYLTLTQFLGFRDYGDEFKVMGLAPYGRPRFADEVQSLVELLPGGRFELDLDCFNHWTGDVTMTWEDGAPGVPDLYTEALVQRLGPSRTADEPIQSRHEDLAASLQLVFELALYHVVSAAHARVPVDALCLAGGCAMNSVANGKILAHTPFRRLYVQPAAADNGTALGAALHAWHAEGGRAGDGVMAHAYWGPSFTDAEIADRLRAHAARLGACTVGRLDDDAALCAHTAGQLADGRIVGWFQGRMEWGARALGNRSILADPRRADMRERLNVKIKARERFRPFAASVPAEALHLYFAGAAADPFMQRVCPVREDQRTVIPAVTHVDGTSRPQAVDRDANPRFWALLRAFGARTGVPVLLNTSFNEHEPIVCSPDEAIDTFLRTGMDVLVLGSHVLEKRDPPAEE